MERIGAGVIIRSNGNNDFNVMMNGIASQEWNRINAKYIERMEAQRKEFEKEIERMKMIKKQRIEQRWKEMEENYGALAEPHVGMRERAKEKIGFALACLICWGEALHLIKYVGGKKNENVDHE
jgi:hypothetical protein